MKGILRENFPDYLFNRENIFYYEFLNSSVFFILFI